ncbi:2OG-Fe(II) oxygenase [Roseibium alexandrii]|uniref:2OG-Fe(II) oxygenase n=1 Tax=Roseibium alexandrii TaxID=388408 RepID=UPI0037539742
MSILHPNFFQEDVLSRILQQFPVPKAEEMVNEFGVPNRKYACHDVRNIGPVYKEIDDYISGQEFANIMGELTGIRDLLYDPEYHGAGTHDNMSGQGMDPHVDFNFHRTTGYHRRLNAIIYLNDEWKEEWGGCLQVHKDPWDPANDWTKTYLPLKNRCVLFETNEYS